MLERRGGSLKIRDIPVSRKTWWEYSHHSRKVSRKDSRRACAGGGGPSLVGSTLRPPEISRMQLFATLLRRAIRIELNKLFLEGQLRTPTRRLSLRPFFRGLAAVSIRGTDTVDFSRSWSKICKWWSSFFDDFWETDWNTNWFVERGIWTVS